MWQYKFPLPVTPFPACFILLSTHDLWGDKPPLIRLILAVECVNPANGLKMLDLSKLE